MDTLTIIIAAIAAISEVLALIAPVKSNSVFQLIFNLIRSLNPHGTARNEP